MKKTYTLLMPYKIEKIKLELEPLSWKTKKKTVI